MIRAAAVLAGIHAGTLFAAPIGLETALPVGEDEWILRQQAVVSDASGGGTNTTAWSTPLALGRGVTGRLAAFGVLPWSSVTVRDASGSSRSDGLGDAALFARFTVHQTDRPGQTFRIAPVAGVVAPTGDDDLDNWSGFVGAIATRQTLSRQFDAQLMYRASSRDRGIRPGDVAQADVSWQERVWPRAVSAYPVFWYAVLEAGVAREGRTEIGGADTASGGTQAWVAPGVQRVGARLVIEAQVRVPVVQNLRSNLEEDYTARIGFRVSF